MQDNTEEKSRTRQPSSLACIPCRRRHLKCDAVMPVCSRCHASNMDCRYVRSRRGFGTKKGTTASQLLDDSIPLFPDVDTDALNWLNTSFSTNIESSQPLFQSLDTPPPLDLDIPSLPDDTLTWTEPENPTTPDVAYDPMIQLYYQSFHWSHPILIPRKALSSSLCRRIPPYLVSIMRYVGAHYHSNPSFKEIFREPAYESTSKDMTRDAFTVQGMLLLAIIAHAHRNEEHAYETLQAAIDLSLELGMNHESFAIKNSRGSSVLEESLRRTYWELYVVDGLLAAMRHHNTFRLYRQSANVTLPCDEELYIRSGSVVTHRHTLEDLRPTSFLGKEQSFSSFAYRIQAVSSLGAVLELSNSLDHNVEDKVETTDASLVASLMNFTTTRQACGSTDSDEMGFQTEMIIYLGMIHLHHPRSNMRFASFQAQTSCTRLRALCYETSPSETFDLHSQKLLRAANMLSNLATLPSPVQCHTPFFTCALAMCVIVHTAACLMASTKDCEESIKARIQLSVGALNMLGRVWPMAKTIRQQVVSMYQEVGLQSR